ncbi:MFS transporter [Ferroplasma sp.]|uniref:MFS transporter n=1 Tax=Ferroplasma sp. TaxID=2591003 RepID=UPI00307EB522
MNSYITMSDAPSSPFLRKITLLSSMGVMMDGYTLTVFSYALLYLINVMSLKSYEISIMGISSISGVLIGSFISGYIADIYGRRFIYVYDLFLVSIFIFLTGFATNYINFSILELIVGFGIGADYPVSSSIQAEFSPAKSRGKFMFFNIFSFSIGSLIFLGLAVPLVLFTGVNAWRYMYMIGAIFPILVLYSRKKIPESPYWIQHKYGNKAGEEMKDKFEALTGYHIEKLPEISPGKTRLGDIFHGKYGIYIIFISIAWFSYDIVSYGIWTYSPLIFSTEITSYYADLYIVFTGMAESIPVVIGFLIAIYYVDRIGRRFLLIAGFLGSFVVLLIFFFVNQYMVVGLLMTFSAFGLVHFFHNVGPSPITYTYPVEIFPTRIRGTAMGFATSVSRFGSILAVFSFPIIDSLYGLKAIIIFFAAFEFIGLAVTLKYAPETKGKALR